MNYMIRKNKTVLLYFFIGILGCILISYNYVSLKIKSTFDKFEYLKYISNSDNLDKLTIENVETENINNSAIETEKSNVEKDYEYIGYIDIPKINLKKGLVAINSKYNTVNKNIEIIKSSNMPNVENGNLILAGHSGTGYLAFFKDLYKLNKNDNIKIIFDNIIYTYKITNIYDVEKNGKINIYKSKDKTTLTLITCTKNNNKSQTIYIAELDRKEEVK